MTAIVSSIEVDRPAPEVFAYAVDPTRFQEWQQGVVDGRMDPPGDPSVGDRLLMTRRIGFMNQSSTSRVSHVETPRDWGVVGVDGPVRAVIDVTVEPVADSRSRLTISVDFIGHGIGKVLVPLVIRGQARKEMPDNLAKLKQRLETDPS